MVKKYRTLMKEDRKEIKVKEKLILLNGVERY
jgi:hypothetical protein